MVRTAPNWRRLGKIAVVGFAALGGVATTGATACYCCAPAFYGVASAVLGLSASPLYWAFLDPASPIGTIFFVAAIDLMTESAIRLVRRLGEVGSVRYRRRNRRTTGFLLSVGR